MRTLSHLLQNNKNWVKEKTRIDPTFFQELSKIQDPEYLWIGCSDSRIPPNEIVGLNPGELFVHRNVSNLILHTDMNCLSVVQFAIENLKVKHIIVCGHYGCGGIRAAMENKQHGLIDHWLRNIKDLYETHQTELNALPTEQARFDRLCELNVIEQTYNLSYTQFVQNAWDRGQELAIHSWIYALQDGLVKDLGLCLSDPTHIPKLFRLIKDQ